MKALGISSFVAWLLIVCAAQGGDDAQKKEKAALEGTWKILSFETNKGKEDGAGATLAFDKEGKVTFTKDDKEKRGTFTVNPAAKPKEIDIKPENESKAFEGIYAIEKDTLKICLAMDAGDGRPNEFALKDGKNYVLMKLERAK